MPRETEPSSNERQFVLQALQESTRIDGRAFDEFRELELSFGDDYGVADVRLGNTRSVLERSMIFKNEFSTDLLTEFLFEYRQK